MKLLSNYDNFQAVRELYVQVNDIGIITVVSRNCYEILGFTESEFLNTYIHEHLDYDFNNLLAHENIQTMISKKDGQRLFFDIISRPMVDGDSKVVGVHLSLINISKYSNIEEQHTQFIKIFQRAKDIVFKYQVLPECKFIYLSPSIIDILGYSAGEHLLNPFLVFELVHPEDVEIQQSKMDKHADFSKTFCTRFKHKNGQYIWLEDYLIPTYDEEGNLTAVEGISRDITERKKLEEELEKSNIIMEKALEVQGEFFANISHELKTPLNVIFATAQLLTMYCNNGSLDERKDSTIKYIDSIKQNSYRLSKLINNIVDSSKIEAGFFELNLSNNNIVAVVEEIVMSITSFTEIKGLNIIFDTEIEEKIIACDPEKIERIVLNLISNAIKFSDEGDEIFVQIKNKYEFIEISVKDHGIGIEANYLDIIFDRFKQVDKSLSRNAEGTGIGLSLVKSIVELHGGRIYVESEFGKGSKFTVVLPTREVVKENMLFNSKIGDKSESVQVELSDVYS